MKWKSCLDRDRLRSVCFSMPIPSLQKLVAALGDEFPMRQYLRIEPLTGRNTHLILSTTFKVAHLCHLVLNHFASPIRSTLLQVATAVGLVTLSLWWIYPSTYPPVNYMLQTHSLLHRLETLEIGFHSPVSKRALSRGNCCICRLSLMSHFQTSTDLRSELSALTWKQFFLK